MRVENDPVVPRMAPSAITEEAQKPSERYERRRRQSQRLHKHHSMSTR
jgi:hypothetical protein